MSKGTPVGPGRRWSHSYKSLRSKGMRFSRLQFSLLALLLFSLGLSMGRFSALMFNLNRVADDVARSGRYYAGRTEMTDPSPKCCHAEDCLARDQGRHAVITSLRTSEYLPLVQELACSLRRTNPDLPLVVYTVRGDLTAAEEDAVRLFAELRYWPRDLQFVSHQNDGRYTLNWVKLRAWELEDEWDAVLLVDSDISFLGNVSYVFSLPAPFAAVPDQDPVAPSFWFSSLGRVQGGFLFLRPCRAVAEHMQAMAASNRLLQYQYEYAEQDFLDWYFKYDRWLLPLEYNSVVPISNGNQTRGGNTAKVIHFTKHKPFGGRDATVPQHRYLTCTAAGRTTAEQERRAASVAELDRYYARRFGAGTKAAGRGAAAAQALLALQAMANDNFSGSSGGSSLTLDNAAGGLQGLGGMDGSGGVLGAEGSAIVVAAEAAGVGTAAVGTEPGVGGTAADGGGTVEALASEVGRSLDVLPLQQQPLQDSLASATAAAAIPVDAGVVGQQVAGQQQQQADAGDAARGADMVR